MITAFGEAYRVPQHPRYQGDRLCSAEFLLTRLYHDGRLLRSYKDGQAKFNAYLDDYAFFTAALLDLYEATFEPVYLDRAVELTDTVLARFWDEHGGGFFFTSSDHEALIARTNSAFDGAIPSGNAVTVFNLLRLSYLTEDQTYLAS
jgi:uncharacterized protein YyaL (SSP411 family)